MEVSASSNKSNVLVTGSSGFIGAEAIRRFARAGYRVIGFDRPGPPYPPPEAEEIDCDIGSDESVRRALGTVLERFGPHLTAVIHLAAYYDFAGEPSPLYERVTVRGTERLLRGLRPFNCDQFIFSSTMLVHAPGEPGLFINEDWPLLPKWDYPRSKIDAENVIRRERGGIPAVMLRIGGVYDDICHSIPLSQQIDRIYRRQLIARVFPGSTAHGQSFVHNEDLAESFELCVRRRRELPDESVMLIGERVPLSYDELQHTFARLIHGEHWETRQIPKAVAKTGAWVENAVPGEDPFIKPWMIDLADDHYALDTTRAKSLLGWETHRDLRETVPKMIDALKRDPVAWFEAHGLEVPKEARTGLVGAGVA
jgi:nucleoside-diphosphate-sugar epimerase